MYILLQYCEKNQNYIKEQLSYFGNKHSFIVQSVTTVIIYSFIYPSILKRLLK